jgi:hypothetical protein
MRKRDAEYPELKVKPLTENMEAELAELIAKRDGPFEFGKTSLNYIRDCWLRNMFNYDEPIVTNEMLKGIMCEEEAIGVLTRQIPSGGFRVKNEVQLEDSHFTGTPDIVGDVWDEDIKCSWTVRTFLEVTKPPSMYYTQGQVYMALTGHEYFRLVYVLVHTPFELVQEEIKYYYFKFNCNEDDPNYIKVSNQITAMHNASRMIPEDQRIKCFEFRRNDSYIKELRSRVELARKFYATLTLGSGYEYE